jgi:hypothetical protein
MLMRRKKIPTEHPVGRASRRLRRQARVVGLRQRRDVAARLAQPLGKEITGRREHGRARKRLPRFEWKKVRRTGPRPNEDQSSHGMQRIG